MPQYKATHIPYGLKDPSKRIVINPGIKDEVNLVKYGIETNGEYFDCKVLVKPGGGVPLHNHKNYGETFMPDIGELGVVGENGAKTMTIKKGESYTVKPGEWHRFFNPSKTEDIVWTGRVRPAHQGFEISLHILYGLAVDGFADKDGLPSLYYTLLCFNMGEVTFPGLGMWFLSWVGMLIGWWSRITGEQERLTRKYYGAPIQEAKGTRTKDL